MATKKHYDEASVIRMLSKKPSISINWVEKHIQISKDAKDIGNGSWGKIDFLCNYCNYTYSFVTAISKKVIVSSDSTKDNEFGNTKSIKREKKINMANMAKSAMKKAKVK